MLKHTPAADIIDQTLSLVLIHVIVVDGLIDV